MAEIQLKEITNRYPDGFEAVKAIDLEIGDAEFMILVGPSGCGKSTALRIIAGLERVGFEGAPRFLGVDDRGREVLSFLPGESTAGDASLSLIVACVIVWCGDGLIGDGPMWWLT